MSETKEKKPRGRPPGKAAPPVYTERMQVMIDPVMRTDLREHAAREDVTMGELVRRVLAQWIEKENTA